MKTKMNPLVLTPRQIQSIIFLFDDDLAPYDIQQFFIENSDLVFEQKKNWVINPTLDNLHFIKINCHSSIDRLNRMIKENEGSNDKYWQNEVKANKINIKMMERILDKIYNL